MTEKAKINFGETRTYLHNLRPEHRKTAFRVLRTFQEHDLDVVAIGSSIKEVREERDRRLEDFSFDYRDIDLVVRGETSKIEAAVKDLQNGRAPPDEIITGINFEGSYGNYIEPSQIFERIRIIYPDLHLDLTIPAGKESPWGPFVNLLVNPDQRSLLERANLIQKDSKSQEEYLARMKSSISHQSIPNDAERQRILNLERTWFRNSPRSEGISKGIPRNYENEATNDINPITGNRYEFPTEEELLKTFEPWQDAIRVYLLELERHTDPFGQVDYDHRIDAPDRLSSLEDFDGDILVLPSLIKKRRHRFYPEHFNRYTEDYIQKKNENGLLLDYIVAKRRLEAILNRPNGVFHRIFGAERRDEQARKDYYFLNTELNVSGRKDDLLFGRIEIYSILSELDAYKSETARDRDGLSP